LRLSSIAVVVNSGGIVSEIIWCPNADLIDLVVFAGED
jgi:hypothetical protein